MKPCVVCGAKDRYPKSGRCRPCVQRRVKAWQQANPQRKKENNEAWRKKNMAYKRAYMKDWCDKHKEKRRAYERKRKGLPEPTRPEPKLCECCNSASGKHSLALDHCHNTNAFRGWLCSDCNSGIGLLGDTEEGVLRALAYLSKVKGL